MPSAFEIPPGELTVRASRASGAGGQHVNKTSSRVEVVWNVAASRALAPDDRAWLLRKLSTRLTADGDLRVVVSDTRSQLRNRDIAMERLAEVVRAALVRPKKRKATKPSRSALRARVEAKKRRSLKKKLRRSSGEE
ncbi:MAG TPA: alternative ribosome rescue aminoacyl-tRNA hydrolase ArfB [Gemmatimonadaceae bacterium]|nr:alternative ribosome rescue aminoacyl-tRNA hydrolase ArfB [Gemmatimonadaceae bacterium]